MSHIDKTTKTPAIDLNSLKGKKIKLKRNDEEWIVEFDAWDFHRLQDFIINRVVSSINTMWLTFDQAIQNVLWLDEPVQEEWTQPELPEATEWKADPAEAPDGSSSVDSTTNDTPKK